MAISLVAAPVRVFNLVCLPSIVHDIMDKITGRTSAVWWTKARHGAVRKHRRVTMVGHRHIDGTPGVMLFYPADLEGLSRRERAALFKIEDHA